MSVYDFSARTIGGDDLALSTYRGHALLVVNVASNMRRWTNRRDSAAMSRRC
jgi:glutathione peroxidase-family protein